MAGIRVLLGVLFLALVQPAAAVEFWPAADCLVYMEDHVEHLEEDVADIEDLLVRIAEAERKGDAASAAEFRRILTSKRVDGIQSMLRRIDTQEYVYCDKSLFDPSLIARVDAARPYAEETEVTVAAVEEVPKIAVTGIATSFVPYEMLEGGGCKGPFLDLTISIVNAGGDYPQPVDFDRTLREYPNADIRAKPMLNLTLLVDWGSGYGQEVIPLPWSEFDTGSFPSGLTVTVPYRLFVPSDETSVKLGGWVTGSWFFAVDGDAMQSATYETEALIPIWDVYTESVRVVTSRDRDDKYKINGAVMATISNLGDSEIPGPVDGSFTVRNEAGLRVFTATGKSLAASQPILAGSDAREIIKGKVTVESSIFPICPDGSYGTLSDGNTANNHRTLEGTG